MQSLIAAICFSAPLSCIAVAADDDRPHAVFVVGTLHYSPELTMPVFAKELERFGFRTTVVMGEGNPEKKTENARITVYHNGVIIHDDFSIPRKTGAGRKEGPEPGPGIFGGQTGLGHGECAGAVGQFPGHEGALHPDGVHDAQQHRERQDHHEHREQRQRPGENGVFRTRAFPDRLP